MKQRELFRRTLTLILCAVLQLPVLPVTVLAEDTTDPVQAGAGETKTTDGSMTVTQGLDDQKKAAVRANGEGASITVEGNVSTDITESEAEDLGAIDVEVRGYQCGYSAVKAYNGGSVEIEGDADLKLHLDTDQGYGDDVAISGIDVIKDGTATVGGNVNVESAINPYLHVKPDAEATPFNPYEALLSHYSMGINNEGGTAHAGGDVTVKDSNYAIGLDAGEKYAYKPAESNETNDSLNTMYELFESYIENHTEADSEGRKSIFTGSIEELIDTLAEARNRSERADITVNGDVNAEGGMYSKGIYARSNGNVTVEGSVSSTAFVYDPASESSEAAGRRRENVQDSEAYYREIYKRQAEWLESHEDYTPEEYEQAMKQIENDLIDEIVSRRTGVNNQGIVAQGYAGVASDEVRNDLLGLLKTLDQTAYNPAHPEAQTDYEEWIYDYLSEHQGLTNLLPLDSSPDGLSSSDFREMLFYDVMKAAMAKGDRTSVSVKGDVTARDAKITKGIMALDSSVEAGGTVSSDGLAAAGIVAIGDEADVSAGSVNAEGDNAAVGVASFGGESRVEDGVVVKSDQDGTGILLRAGTVSVGSDVTVDASERSNGISTIALDNRMITVMGLNDADSPEEWYRYFEDTIYGEAIWNCINRYSDEMNTGDILSYFINNDSSQSVIVDGTVTAKNGVNVIGKQDAAKLAEDYVVNMFLYRNGRYGGFEWDEANRDPREMTDEELVNALDVEYGKSGDVADLYRACLALRTAGKMEDNGPDLTLWRIDADHVVNHDVTTYSWKNFLNNWTYTMPNWESRYQGEDWENVFDSTVEIDHGRTAEQIQKGINYIIRIGSVTGGDGTISLNGAREHNGFTTAREGETVTVYVKCADGYEVESISGLFASLKKNPDGSYTLTVPEGGGVQIDAILRLIDRKPEVKKKNPDPEEKTEPEEKAEPEQKKAAEQPQENAGPIVIEESQPAILIPLDEVQTSSGHHYRVSPETADQNNTALWMLVLTAMTLTSYGVMKKLRDNACRNG